MSKFYYVTAATKEEFIRNYAQYAVKSLINTGIDKHDIHVIVNDAKDISCFKECGVDGVIFYEADINTSHVKWKYFKGKRVWAYFKSAAMNKFFREPIVDRYMIFFDGDVLWYKDPTPFFETKFKKTWYHHGKGLKKRSEAGRRGLDAKDIDVTNYKSLSSWCSAPQAHLMVKFGAKIVPDREVVSGLYLLHPRDHKTVMAWTLRGCEENSNLFSTHEGAGEQKPMNAALAINNIDWDGGSRFFCPEHREYFDHFFGAKKMKKDFRDKLKEIGLY